MMWNLCFVRIFERKLAGVLYESILLSHRDLFRLLSAKFRYQTAKQSRGISYFSQFPFLIRYGEDMCTIFFRMTNFVLLFVVVVIMCNSIARNSGLKLLNKQMFLL